MVDKILLDTNILLDYLLMREPFYDNASEIVRKGSLCTNVQSSFLWYKDLSVKQPITLLSEKPCYDAQYCAYQNCRNDGADAHTAGIVNS